MRNLSKPLKEWFETMIWNRFWLLVVLDVPRFLDYSHDENVGREGFGNDASKSQMIPIHFLAYQGKVIFVISLFSNSPGGLQVGMLNSVF